jgi:hypothetical protein
MRQQRCALEAVVAVHASLLCWRHRTRAHNTPAHSTAQHSAPGAGAAEAVGGLQLLLPLAERRERRAAEVVYGELLADRNGGCRAHDHAVAQRVAHSVGAARRQAAWAWRVPGTRQANQQRVLVLSGTTEQQRTACAHNCTAPEPTRRRVACCPAVPACLSRARPVTAPRPLTSTSG